MEGGAVKCDEYTEALEKALKEIWEVASFDWDSMPEDGRREFRVVVERIADDALRLKRKHCPNDFLFEHNIHRENAEESRTRTLLRGMIAALDAGDEVKYFECFEALQTVTLEILGENA